MKVLVACEFSGVVRRAFRKRGHDAWSCDLLPAWDKSPHHIEGDATKILNDGWDLLIAHPPCTRLCSAGSRWLHNPPPGRKLDTIWEELRQGAELFSVFLNAPVHRRAVENPVMHRHAKELIENYREYSQKIEPWWFGHKLKKATCLWLHNLPPLMPAGVVAEPKTYITSLSPSPDRWKERSLTFEGVANAMADQWGTHGRQVD